MAVNTIQWVNGKIRIIDQTLLPEKLVYLDIDNVETLAEAIKNLKIRGAPAIGIAGAMGAALAAQICEKSDGKSLLREVEKSISYLAATRPTAVNLFWALERMKKLLISLENEQVSVIKDRLLSEALTVLDEDIKVCHQMGRNGASLLPEEATVLTHCNAGGLATSGYGTALGVIYAAKEMGKKIKVYSDETRPLLQGSRLTAWELKESGIDVTVLCDSSAGFLMEKKKIDCVLVGADRIAANGDTANKIGTYTLAVLAKEHSIPFYVVAPVSTFDFSLYSGEEIPIEERSPDEVINGFGVRTGPEGVNVYNPAFDVTPHNFITAFVTEQKVLYPPYKESIETLKLR